MAGLGFGFPRFFPGPQSFNYSYTHRSLKFDGGDGVLGRAILGMEEALGYREREGDSDVDRQIAMERE